jgi:hypothetical protein
MLARGADRRGSRVAFATKWIRYNRYSLRGPCLLFAARIPVQLARD